MGDVGHLAHEEAEWWHVEGKFEPFFGLFEPACFGVYGKQHLRAAPRRYCVSRAQCEEHCKQREVEKFFHKQA